MALPTFRIYLPAQLILPGSTLTDTPKRYALLVPWYASHYIGGQDFYKESDPHILREPLSFPKSLAFTKQRSLGCGPDRDSGCLASSRC